MAKETEKTVYETKIHCKNCQNEIEVQILIGITVKKYREKAKCNVCLCPLK